MKRLYVLVHKGWLEMEHNYENLFKDIIYLLKNSVL